MMATVLSGVAVVGTAAALALHFIDNQNLYAEIVSLNTRIKSLEEEKTSICKSVRYYNFKLSIYIPTNLKDQICDELDISCRNVTLPFHFRLKALPRPILGKYLMACSMITIEQKAVGCSQS